MEITRERSYRLDDKMHIPVGPELPAFFELVKQYARTFHDLIHPADGVERFLGNASFRCERGFPSFRHGKDVYVSRRNIDKRFIGPDMFVRVELKDHGVGYYGSDKPSVDTPVQLRLYDFFTRVRYMLHSHVYIKDAPFTDHAIPCGALEEVNEVIATFINEKNSAMARKIGDFSINLLGHGSIVFADNLNYMRSVQYYAREIPEVMGAP